MPHIARGGRPSRNGSSWVLLLLAPLMREFAGAQTASPSATPTIPPSINLGSASCDRELLFSMRSTWASPDEPCGKKLPFGLWALMEAEGTSQNANAKHVLQECLQEDDVVLVELITTEEFNSTVVNGAPGEVVGETNHTATYYCRSALDFEAICADDNVIRASRVDPVESRRDTQSVRSRRLKDTLSEAGVVHKVEELIAGLEDLGCARTRGEGQNLCLMSDSFDLFEQASDLQESGDLPASVDVVKELTDFSKEYKDEGSAMMELAFDIASGANFKFNTAFMGEQTFADDIVSLATKEGCDVIVDDVTYPFAPAFRDGPVAQAVDEATEEGTLYFTSAGNSGTGFIFVAEFECTTELDLPTVGECSEGVAAHVFDDSLTGADRYLFPIPSDRISGDTTFLVQWDDDDFSARAIVCNVIAVYIETGDVVYMEDGNDSGRATSRCFIPDTSEYSFYLAITQLDSLVEPVTMRLVALGGVGNFFSQRSVGGSIFGQACATTAISVAAMDWDDASGSDGAFDDPETASVTRYSARGPCLVDGDGSGDGSGDGGLETREHPVTTAATKLQTSSIGFDMFMGTSASAPVAAAIATLIRAACSDEKVITHSDMMEMLTNYEYTIDVTSDADGAVETYGTEAGYGIISAEQMLGWVASNCQEACPGAAQASPAPVVTSAPARIETPSPTPRETPAPTLRETPAPTPRETLAPTLRETPAPTPRETPAPTLRETPAPTPRETSAPTPRETLAPTLRETPSPTPRKTSAPTPRETLAPTLRGTPAPTRRETPAPTFWETPTPTSMKTSAPALWGTPAPIFIETLSPIFVETPTPSTASATAPPTSVDTWTCSNGINGVEGYGHCCPVECGTCGGRNCRKRAEEAGLDATDCCVQRIDESGVYCNDSGTAPCIIDLEEPQSSPCSNGVRGIEGYGHCCVLECGRCGGKLCRHRAENAGLEATDCCVQRINESGVYCDESGTAPCIINSE